MDDIIIDDVIKSDVYSVSINELMFSGSYRPNVISVSRLLDDNGYYGRYNIEIIKHKKFGIDTLVKIHIYLCDSSYTYSWPFSTFFNLDKKSFGDNRKIPRGVFTDVFLFKYCVRILSVMFMPRSMIKNPSWYDVKCIISMDTIKYADLGINSWPSVICSNHSGSKLEPAFKKIIPYLSRVGLIVDNKFRIIGPYDALEICENQFDINYWSNL